jgi:hypothetical protein
MKRYTAQSGREYLLRDNVAEPCFNGAGFAVQYGSIEDIERFDAGLHWNNLMGQYSHGSTLGFEHQRLRQGNRG